MYPLILIALMFGPPVLCVSIQTELIVIWLAGHTSWRLRSFRFERSRIFLGCGGAYTIRPRAQTNADPLPWIFARVHILHTFPCLVVEF